jgi:outer membrane protein TolC
MRPRRELRTELKLVCLVACALFGCLGANSLAAQETASASLEVLTLERAVAQALEHNRTIKISNENAFQANAQILAARTQRYPQFNVQLIGSYLLTPVSISFPAGAFGNVGGTPVPNVNSPVVTSPKFSGMSVVQAYQPLSQLYNIHLNLGSLQVNKRLSEEQLRQQRQQITNSVKSAYYGLLQTQSAIGAAESNIQALRELDRSTDANVQQKTALQYQSTGVKAQLAQAELQLVTLQDTLATQKENLNSLMGRDIRTDFKLGGVPETLPEESNLEAARQEALANRTEIHQAKIKIDQAVFAKRIEKAQYIPEVGIQYLFFSPFTIQGLPQNINSLGISLKWDLYDWGYKRHVMEQKQSAIEQSHLNLTETQSQVLIDLDNNYRKLREARANLKVAQIAQDAESQKLQVVLEQYKQNTVLLSSVEQERATMAQLAAQYQQALDAFWTARANFEKSLGED